MPDPSKLESLRYLYVQEECVLRQRIQALDCQRIGLVEKLTSKRAQIEALRKTTAQVEQTPAG